jgi:hypothetical protein
MEGDIFIFHNYYRGVAPFSAGQHRLLDIIELFQKIYYTHNMKKLTIATTILFSLGIGCCIAYQLSPNYIDEQGILHEAFGFIPLGYLFFFTGIITGIISLVKYIKKK